MEWMDGIVQYAKEKRNRLHTIKYIIFHIACNLSLMFFFFVFFFFRSLFLFLYVSSVSERHCSANLISLVNRSAATTLWYDDDDNNIVGDRLVTNYVL